eukprot:TRINITY_DN36360_c1_g3_i3.p1 TRINITY_DN36360_c1_g3~~TRINITY_DN36360_c1_g3_i3.p1  ORF type:complete len:595 (+),score=101.16 TRINITY_DN36360_c1_g3_i3:195-1979(+)
MRLRSARGNDAKTELEIFASAIIVPALSDLREKIKFDLQQELRTLGSIRGDLGGNSRSLPEGGKSPARKDVRDERCQEGSERGSDCSIAWGSSQIDVQEHGKLFQTSFYATVDALQPVEPIPLPEQDFDEAEDTEMAQLLQTTLLSQPSRSTKTGLQAQALHFWQLGFTDKLDYAIQSPIWDVSVSILLLLNAAFLGIQTDQAARLACESAPGPAEYCFCIAFTLELLSRMRVNGAFFFSLGNPDWHWNIFDAFVVFSQIFDLMLGLADNMEHMEGMQDIKSLRVVRVLRLVRVIRLVRVLHLIGELRSMVNTIVASFRSLFWGLLLLFMLIYIVSVLFLQAVTQHRIAVGDSSLSEEHRRMVHAFYSSLPRTLTCMWAAITGGVEWVQLMEPLTAVSPAMELVFILYIAFVLLAIMNSLTAIFIETAMKTARAEEEAFVAKSVASHFAKHHSADWITWQTFQDELDSDELQDLLVALNVDKSAASRIYQMTDSKNSGVLTADQIVHGWTKLQGNATTLDLATHMRRFDEHAQDMEQSLHTIISKLQELHDEHLANQFANLVTLGNASAVSPCAGKRASVRESVVRQNGGGDSS